MQEKSNEHKGEKREAIFQAALELAAEQGLQHMPMSQISKRSGASAGIIYHYFESKEDLLTSLYTRIKERMGRAVVAADDPQQPLAKRFQTLWLSVFRYCLAHPQEMAFLDQYESSPEARQQNAWLQSEMITLDDLIAKIHTQGLVEQLPPDIKTLYGLIADLQAQGLLKNLPLLAIGEFTFRVAFRLAQQASAGFICIDEAVLVEIARACWDAIAR